MESSLRIVNHGSVTELMLDRPASLNAISTAFAGEIATATAEIEADELVRAVVITSSSRRAFCVGADLKERREANLEETLRRRDTVRSGYAGVRRLSIPVVAAVAGYALGGGFELALSCDIIVADPTAVFGLPEVTLGMVPGGGGTQLLARRIGYGRAADLILTGRRIGSDEAERRGIVDRQAPSGAARETALDIATVIATHSPAGVRGAKCALRTGLDVALEDGIEMENTMWSQAIVAGGWRSQLDTFAARRGSTRQL